MAGLLDLFGGDLSDDQRAGLLSAAARMFKASGPSLRPTSGLQVLGEGIDAHQNSVQEAQQNALINKLRGLQVNGLQAELDDKKRSRKDALEAQNLLRKYNAERNTDTGRAQSILGSNLAPTLENAAKLEAAPQAQQDGPFTERMSMAQFMRNSGNPVLMSQADKLEEQALKFRPKYSTDFRPALGGDGKIHNYMLADDGTWKDTGLGVKPDVTEVDLGGTKKFVDRNSVVPGTEFKKTQSPDSLAIDRRSSQARSSQNDSADALLPDQTVQLMAQQYLAGDTSVVQNLGRGAQGAQNIVRLRNEIARQAQAGGLAGADLAAKNAEYFGTKAGQRTAGTRIANVEMASTEAQSLIPLAREASSAVARSSLLPFGKAQVMFNEQTNDPALRKFAAANNALVNVYSRAISPSGVPTVADKEHAREMISTAMDQRSYNAVLDQMEAEITAARAAPKAVRQAFNSEVTGRSEYGQVAKPQPAKTFDMLPPAAQYDGKRMRADNGTVYRSVGGKWVKE